MDQDTIAMGFLWFVAFLFSTTVHEAMHALVARRLGAVRYAILPGWNNEGFADYVARESSFGIDSAVALVREGRDDPSPAFRYAVDRLLVAYALDVQRRPPLAFLTEPADPELLHRDVQRALAEGRWNPAADAQR
jgi:hypothetical protein